MQNFCHGGNADYQKGLQQGCPFFPTKPDNVDPAIINAVAAAELLRSYNTLGNLPKLAELTAWEWACYRIASEAISQVEAEAMKEASGKTTKVDTPLGISGEVEEGGAFSKW